MSTVYITSDWHLGHRNITKFRQVFSSMEEHNECLIENYKSIVTKRDTVWFLGDMCFDNEYCSIIKSLPGDKRLVLGNHDTDRKCDLSHLIEAFDQVHGLVSYKAAWLSHAPIHNSELRGRYNIHGHTHSSFVPDPRYYNVCVENTEFKPKSYQSILLELRGRSHD